LQRDGRIRHWGVSNFDVADMEELWSLQQGTNCAANQVYYSASRRGIEFDLAPWQRDKGVPTMAYCPIDEGALAKDARLAAIGRRHNISAAQVALAWVMSRPDVIAIPKAVRPEHLQQNFESAEITLGADDLAEIDRHFPPPHRRTRLTMV
jgi:diketogulonate reductase-like aldo/keto reductase